ncbi:DNA mismatch repair protein MutS [Segetibacter sp. 3557_3]|uniref:MutS-related protein n=1 Tax=Segetibacter sp. 3557_3 TaxID=2547429 RepID=UPI001058AA76|nr:DNA mismatch repair protein MutS [Segetibacter sp. 3557_3]TDH23013.1 DNA mismatch repair protein MutS [Segetibacter sp. 3557_3]
MQIDKTTLNDLSIFHSEEEQSVLHHLDYTTTIRGKEWLRFLLAHPFSELSKITETQRTIQLIIGRLDKWPATITNGTVMVIDKFYDSSIGDLPAQANTLNALSYRFLNAPDYSLVKYSVNHFIDFVKGLKYIVDLFGTEELPPLLRNMLERISMLLRKPVVSDMLAWNKGQKLSAANVITFGNFLRRNFKQEAFELVELYSRLDAYYSFAVASTRKDFVFPVFNKENAPSVKATGLFHLMIPEPVSYDVDLQPDRNFLFLTGANMAGKSTFIKAVGVSVYLAHIGMGVPATSLELSIFDGLLSNIQVEDNITKGESYFFNEVQRIKKTIVKINDGRNWLILIDELFKGTNVQDAMKCSTSVIEGLRKMKNALFILSTHLYEIGEPLRQFPNIQFKFFETSVQEDQLIFNYHLKDGISNDRLGYLILKREGVVNMLENL